MGVPSASSENAERSMNSLVLPRLPRRFQEWHAGCARTGATLRGQTGLAQPSRSISRSISAISASVKSGVAGRGDLLDLRELIDVAEGLEPVGALRRAPACRARTGTVGRGGRAGVRTSRFRRSLSSSISSQNCVGRERPGLAPAWPPGGCGDRTRRPSGSSGWSAVRSAARSARRHSRRPGRRGRPAPR